MPQKHLGSGAARPNTYRVQRRAIVAVSRVAEKPISHLSEVDQQLVLQARAAGRPLDPKIFRELDSRGLVGYL